MSHFRNITVAFALVAFACTTSPVSTPGVRVVDTAAVLRVAIPKLPRTLDWTSDSATVQGRTFRLIYDQLVDIDGEGKVQPSLATSWRLVDPTTWEFKLRPGVKFHNSEAFDANAVRATIKYVQDPKTKGVQAARLDPISDVKIVDDSTVQILTKTPFPVLPKVLASVGMLPPKYLGDAGVDRFGLAPIGTGPFKVTEFKPEQVARLERFDAYWRGKAQVAGILLQQLVEDSARVAALQAGEIDIAYEVPFDQIESLRQAKLQIVTGSVGTSWGVALRDSVKPLDDPRVRLALNYATNVDAINKAVFAGLAIPLRGQFAGPVSTGFDPDLKAYGYDPDRSRKLLTDAGYPNGFTIRFESSSGRFFKDKEVAEAVCLQWATVGVKCDLALLESTVWLQRYIAGTLGPVMAAPFALGPEMDLGLTLSLVFAPSSPRKLVTSAPAIDDLFQQQQKEMDDQKRAQILRNIAKMFNEKPPAVYLFENVGVYAAADNVQGAVLRPDYSINPLSIALMRR